MTTFRCPSHGTVEPKQTPEKVLQFKGCEMTVVRMECPFCGQRVAREEPEWKEMRELAKQSGRRPQPVLSAGSKTERPLKKMRRRR